MSFFPELIWATIFCAGLLTILFAYMGFPIILKIIDIIIHWFYQHNKIHAVDKLAEVQIIISCYNEADIIRKTITDKLGQDYPEEKLSVLVISDGSTDGSNEIVREIAESNPLVKLFPIEVNSGKNNAINLAFSAGEFTGSLLCFTDVDTTFDPGILASAVSYFSNSKVGLVGGKISYWLGSGSTSQAEGVFWRLENFIREEEGNLGWLVSCPGQFIMMRRELFQPLPAEANTDFAMPLMVLAQGYETRFDKNARVWSLFPASQEAVIKRRKRTIIRALTTIAAYKHRLSWKVRLVLFWHKTARFYLLPVQGTTLVANFVLASTSPSLLWVALFLAQLTFYGSVLLGWGSARFNLKIPWVHLPYQFTLQHAVAFTAVLAFLCGQRVSKWVPPR